MSRSLKKGPYIDERLLEKVRKAKASGNRQAIKTWRRACTITPDMIGTTFAVHNGKNFISVFVDENMVGHRLGEFSPTRKFVVHGGKMAKEQASAASAKASAPATAPTGSASAKTTKK